MLDVTQLTRVENCFTWIINLDLSTDFHEQEIYGTYSVNWIVIIRFSFFFLFFS